MTRRVIFLDMNGVINNNKVEICEEAILVLKYLLNKYNAIPVLISTNLLNGTENIKKKLRDYFLKLGIDNLDFIDSNFDYRYEHNYRGGFYFAGAFGIIDYLKKNDYPWYVILDDCFREEYACFKLNHYEVDGTMGLVKNDLKHIKFKKPKVKYIAKVKYHYRKLQDYEIVTNRLIDVVKRVRDKKRWESEIK